MVGWTGFEPAMALLPFLISGQAHAEILGCIFLGKLAVLFGVFAPCISDVVLHSSLLTLHSLYPKFYSITVFFG